VRAWGPGGAALQVGWTWVGFGARGASEGTRRRAVSPAHLQARAVERPRRDGGADRAEQLGEDVGPRARPAAAAAEHDRRAERARGVERRAGVLAGRQRAAAEGEADRRGAGSAEGGLADGDGVDDELVGWGVGMGWGGGGEGGVGEWGLRGVERCGGAQAREAVVAWAARQTRQGGRGA
jgi:hypothetical protein